MTPGVARGREAFERRAWSDAHAEFTAAMEQGELGPRELEDLAVAAYFAGHDDESHEAWDRAHRAWLEVGDVDRAARCAAWLGLALLFRGANARASGWFQRGRRLIAGTRRDGAARGYLLVPEAIRLLGSGDPQGALARWDEIVRVAERHGDADLLALGLMGRGEASVHFGDTDRGLAFLDDAMVSVTSGEVSELMAGLLYCAVLEVCMKVCDLRRGVEWTDEFTRWCDATGMVPYRGQCLIHRSQILQAHGQWADALAEAARAETWLANAHDPGVGFAHYQRGELHRLRGELEAAETAYCSAAEHGHEPAPGLALLRLAEGRMDNATATVKRMLDEAVDVPARLAVLPATVEIALATGDLDTAALASDELSRTTAGARTDYLDAVASHCAGAVALRSGEWSGALVALRHALRFWRQLEMPYERARDEVLVGDACRCAGDHDAADRAHAAARHTFEHLGAVIDLAGLDRSGRRTTPPGSRSGLTERECEVLRLVATGRTNREIGTALSISEHTVARHVQNIFTKIGVGSRSAATSHAYEHGIV